jgi:AraC-like DNA-binding protein
VSAVSGKFLGGAPTIRSKKQALLLALVLDGAWTTAEMGFAMPRRKERPSSPGFAAFGDAVRTAFRVPDAPVLLARDLTYGPLSVTELRCDADGYGTSGPLPEHDALMVSLQFRPSVDHEIWEDGKRLPKVRVETGSTSFFDLRRAVIASSMRPFHSLNFVFPLRALDEAGDEVLHRFELGRGAQQGVEDPVIRALGTSLLPAIERPLAVSRMFVDHVLFALRTHVAGRFGTPADRFTEAGGLAVWQERRAREFIEARLADNVALVDVARECELSVAQFARAFKRSTGLPPHRYLTERRIDRARLLLIRSDLPLADVAVRCGFADQSHFTKRFRRSMGVGPGSYRRGLRAKRA